MCDTVTDEEKEGREGGEGSISRDFIRVTRSFSTLAERPNIAELVANTSVVPGVSECPQYFLKPTRSILSHTHFLG